MDNETLYAEELEMEVPDHALNTLKRIGRNDKELVNLRELFNDLMVLCAAYSSHPLVLITD